MKKILLKVQVILIHHLLNQIKLKETKKIQNLKINQSIKIILIMKPKEKIIKNRIKLIKHKIKAINKLCLKLNRKVNQAIWILSKNKISLIYKGKNNLKQKLNKYKNLRIKNNKILMNRIHQAILMIKDKEKIKLNKKN